MASVFCSISPAFAEAPAKQPCWEVIQTSLLAGKHRIVFSPTAFRIESIGNRYVVVSKAPTWKVYAFNYHSKLICESDLQGFKGNLAAGTNALGGYLENLPVLRAPQKPVTFLGQPALKMRVVNPNPQNAEASSRKFSSVFFNTGDVLAAEYWTWSNPQVPASLPYVLNKMYRLPPGKSFPFKLLTTNTEREKHAELETSGIRAVPYASKEFDIPKSFKVVQDDIEIANDKRRQRTVKNLMESWDDWGKIVETGK